MRDKGGAAFRSVSGTATRRRTGQNIRDLRIAKDKSQEELASEIRTTAKHLSRIEAGLVNVTINVLSAIARRLSVGVAELTPSRMRKGQQLLFVTKRDLKAIVRIAKHAERARVRRHKKPRRGKKLLSKRHRTFARPR
ncbi:MAG TPA: helix-turn-helix transcriptional regulator [Vicinamibacterales bacterium]|jgi:transcriptional regulator with XRE-family HTH domain|nr:helix-turn-helix transcriptional regulator [Vicinamibacterales bacterium]